MADFDVGRLVVPQSGLDDPSHGSDSNSQQSNLSAPCQLLLTPAVHSLPIVSIGSGRVLSLKAFPPPPFRH